MAGYPPNSKLRVAIIGAGPAGLGAAIEFAKLPFVDPRVYEQARELREIGTGISIQRNTWRMLEALGVYENVDPKSVFRAADGHSTQHRNGRTGELLVSHGQKDTPRQHLHARALRSVLQKALLQGVDQSRLRLSSKLVHIAENPSGTLSLCFEDGHRDEVDLLVGADGVRSVVRAFAFPDHRISYTGQTAYRALVKADEVLGIPGFPDAVTFWHAPENWVYTCNLNNNIYEVTARTPLPPGTKTVSWGQAATLEEMRRPFKEYCPVVQAVLDKVQEVTRFDLFAGSHLPSVVSRGSVALVGDASHPLSGAFGAGAGFALEDAYVLTQAVKWAHERNLPAGDGLDLFDKVRTPHYKQMYAVLGRFAAADASIKGSKVPFDEAVALHIKHNWTEEDHWLYHYDVQEVWKKAYEAEDTRRAEQGKGIMSRL